MAKTRIRSLLTRFKSSSNGNNGGNELSNSEERFFGKITTRRQENDKYNIAGRKTRGR